MKLFITSLLLISAFSAFGQAQTTPTFYLNADSFDYDNTYINPNSIESMVVENKTKNGEIYMKTRNVIEFLTLDFILQAYTDIKEDKNIVYVIDGKLVTNKQKVRIDKTYFIYVKTKKIQDVNYIKGKYKDLVLVEITLSTKKIEPEIRIRGEELVKSN